MTTDRSYRCNMCGQSIQNGAAGRGVHFHTHRIEFKPLREVEHHICTLCLNGLMDAFAADPLPSTDGTK